MGYLYPKQHTIFHVIDNAGMPLEQLVSPFQFEARMFPTSLSVRELIRALAPEGDDDKWGVTEMHEVGDDRWAVGQTILLNSDLAKKTLGETGWTEKRGTSAKPVWLKIHHID